MSNNLEGLIESHKKEEPGAKGMHYWILADILKN
jgi:hypothetical protein